MAAPAAKDELETLQEARSQLEAALASDEFWRALRQPASDDTGGGAAAARRARNVRLEKALANNELYQAWKHLNQAINALRVRRPEAGAQAHAAVEANVEPQPRAVAEPDRPRRRRLQSKLAEMVPPETPQALPLAGEGLMRRLADVTPPLEETAATVAPQRTVGPSGGGDPRPTAEDEYEGRSDLPEPPEAIVTFVVREPAHARQVQPRQANDDAQETNGHLAGNSETPL